ncbi:hypothetical protein N0V82_009665 [Gnomoniopsis sp. IMI 355080]|nr:hypothetical protein N0V82_009665 [Gnomoniopsis sp. IMI 355080]
MSLFPRSYFSPEASFTPLFRLLDDFDNYSREVAPNRQGDNASRSRLPTFSPRFDVKETETGYELHGEIPGAEKDNISIEFTEPQTIVISGRTERSYTSGTPPAGLVEGGNTTSGAITDGKDKNSHKATVEDESAQKAKEAGSEVTKADQQGKQEQQRPKERFWVSERSVGEFSRTFSFPTPVNQEAVSANLKDGVLSVVVPKATKKEAKRITVN